MAYLANNVLKINYIKATNIVILKATADDVIDVLFWSKTKTKDGYEYLLNLHILNEAEGYIIYNTKKVESGKSVIDVDLGESKEIHTYSYIPKFRNTIYS